jgi:hypothetical protein
MYEHFEETRRKFKLKKKNQENLAYLSKTLSGKLGRKVIKLVFFFHLNL